MPFNLLNAVAAPESCFINTCTLIRIHTLVDKEYRDLMSNKISGIIPYIMVCNKSIASCLPSLRARLVEDHVKLINLTAFLHNFQELIPIVPKRKQNEMVNQMDQKIFRNYDEFSSVFSSYFDLKVLGLQRKQYFRLLNTLCFTYSVIRVSRLPIQSLRSSILSEIYESIIFF